jgi:hypothetical protein
MTFESESAHYAHDTLRIAAYTLGDLSANESAAAHRQIRDCRECAALHSDLTSLSTALTSLSKTATAPRDFRISPEQAARLRGGPWWRRIARSIAAPRGFGRPLATAFTTLGLVGLLIGTLPAGFLPMAAQTFDRVTTTTEGAGAPQPGPTSVPTDDSQQLYPAAGSGGGQGSGEGRGNDNGYQASPSPDSKDGSKDLLVSREVGSTSTLPVFGLAFTFLAVGIGLFAVRRFGRRLT